MDPLATNSYNLSTSAALHSNEKSNKMQKQD